LEIFQGSDIHCLRTGGTLSATSHYPCLDEDFGSSSLIA
jgi:hypothetical protein